MNIDVIKWEKKNNGYCLRQTYSIMWLTKENIEWLWIEKTEREAELIYYLIEEETNILQINMTFNWIITNLTQYYLHISECIEKKKRNVFNDEWIGVYSMMKYYSWENNWFDPRLFLSFFFFVLLDKYFLYTFNSYLSREWVKEKD